MFVKNTETRLKLSQNANSAFIFGIVIHILKILVLVISTKNTLMNLPRKSVSFGYHMLNVE